MNTVILMGRLTADPEVRYTQDQKAFATFTLAVDRRVARKEGQTTADFIRCTAWEKRAEFAEKYLRKGSRIALRGRIQTGSYTDRDGKKVYTTDVVAEEIEFAGEKKETQQTAPEPHQMPSDSFMDVPDDTSLPFA